MKKTKWLLLSILLFLALSPSLALAAGTGGGGALPWETPLQNVQQSLTGPVAIVGALGSRKQLGKQFYQEIATANTENGNSFLRPSSVERAKTRGKEIRDFLQGILPLGARVVRPTVPRAPRWP